MWVSAGINNLRTLQARLSANDYADKTFEWFERDYDLEHEYHTMLDGKWDQCVFVYYEHLDGGSSVYQDAGADAHLVSLRCDTLSIG